MKKLFLVVFLCTAFLFVGTTAMAIPNLGVAPGIPGDSNYFDFAGDPIPMPLSGGDLTVWYGNKTSDLSSNIWLLTTSANGGTFTWNSNPFTLKNELQYNPYFGQPNIWGINLGNASGWASFPDTNPDPNTHESLFHGYDFWGQGFVYLNGTLGVGDGAAIGDWMYAILDNDPEGQVKILGNEFSPPTTSSQAVPEPATLLLLGGGLVGLAGFGRKKFKK